METLIRKQHRTHSIIIILSATKNHLLRNSLNNEIFAQSFVNISIWPFPMLPNWCWWCSLDVAPWFYLFFFLRSIVFSPQFLIHNHWMWWHFTNKSADTVAPHHRIQSYLPWECECLWFIYASSDNNANPFYMAFVFELVCSCWMNFQCALKYVNVYVYVFLKIFGKRNTIYVLISSMCSVALIENMPAFKAIIKHIRQIPK